MKTLKTTLLIALSFVLFTNFAIAQNNESELLTLSEITVKPGKNTQFTDGVVKWKKCYLKNKGSDKWNVWKRVQGKGNFYVVTGRLDNWAEMDKDDEAGNACRNVAQDFIWPNVKSLNYSITQTMPEFSRMPLEGTKLVWVNFFRVKSNTKFNQVVKDITSSIKKSEGQPRGFWYSYMGGGPDSPDYMVSTPFKNYAGLDVQVDGVWKVYENAHGKKKTDELRVKASEAIESSWSYLYSLNEKMSN